MFNKIKASFGKHVDECLAKYGYDKVFEDEDEVCYHNVVEVDDGQDYTQGVTINRQIFKSVDLTPFEGEDDDGNTDMFYEAVGVEIPALFLFWLKAKCKGWKA